MPGGEKSNRRRRLGTMGQLHTSNQSRPKMRRILIFSICMVLLPSSAGAKIVQYVASGTINQMNLDFNSLASLGPIHPGDPFTASFSFDDSVPSANGPDTSTSGFYPQSTPSFQFTFTVGTLHARVT